jgi:hypothetical protein
MYGQRCGSLAPAVLAATLRKQHHTVAVCWWFDLGETMRLGLAALIPTVTLA